ncbi:hypothetical protein FC764_11465 [Clostridium botulinum]|uniref:hypothetical protein n=1 Tax=Clostridium botulinum TaxID=1491 RepID=UPI0013FCD32B|nr:hypothetical protein [Clostridium botulinum]MBN1060014.1 hypothetical protein [Clostridium botulinum]MBN1063160.1 hypothetical protein [Clostridium botulinum]NFF81845.1 hypothetical protein [Clostridium botulinum]
MKIKKLMSICAMSLAVVCCTSVTTFAAQNSDARSDAAKKVTMNFWKEGYVIDGINININTPIKNYVTEDLLDFIKDLEIADFDTSKGIKENLEKISEKQAELKEAGKLDELIKNEENLMKIKDFVKDMLADYEDAANGDLKDKNGKIISLAECIKYDFNVDAYGNLTVGKNMNGKTTATLEDKRGNILFQVNSENIYNMKSELSGINSWSELKDWMKNYVDKSTLDGLNALNK